MPSQTIGLLLYPGCMPAGLFAFADLLSAANQQSGKRHFELRWIGQDLQAVECAHGLRLQPQAALAEARCDAVLVPGLWADNEARVAQALERSRALLHGLSRLSRRTRLWSYCTGVCLLAASGRLDGEEATATWWLADSLRARFPGVDWQFQRTQLFGTRVATASGVSGYLPIARALIEERLGAEAYRELSRMMVLPRPEPAAPVFRALDMTEQSDPLLRRLRLLVERHPARLLAAEQLAQELALSGRTLARKVKALTGHALAEHVRLIKLNQAGERLILTSESVALISEALGFADESSFRRTFKRVTGMTPLAYRQSFRL
ncbi:helix-turn-helix domain-containing protein [Pseudomonas sp. CAU 1711]|uniref:GlxA family transcriptional regulator n=1 Tax=Pseudomonas sp. CAU 1711 TaxID=3140356 RepID=UPI0032602DAD